MELLLGRSRCKEKMVLLLFGSLEGINFKDNEQK